MRLQEIALQFPDPFIRHTADILYDGSVLHQHDSVAYICRMMKIMA